MSQFQILGRRPFPFKAIPIRFAYTNFPDTISFGTAVLRPAGVSRILGNGVGAEES